MALKNYYHLLEIATNATSDEVKRAFRQQIARYHPDKVQHLGKELQQLAADRTAELTEAYRTLSDERRRAEYDRALAATDQPAAAAPSSKPEVHAPDPAAASVEDAHASPGQIFAQERAGRDELVRRAAIARFRHVVAALGGDYDETAARGFDVAWLPKNKMFTRNSGPRIVGRFVARVDGVAVAYAWTHALRWAPEADVCVFLIGTEMAPRDQLEAAFVEQRRRSPNAKVTVIPIDARGWDAHMPIDAPTIAKSMMQRLRAGG